MSVLRVAVGCAVVGLAVFAAGLHADAHAAWLAYLGAWTFATGLSVGSLLLLMTGHAAKAAWMIVTRRLTEALASALPVLLALFVPVFFALPRVYPWASGSWGEDAPASPWGARDGYLEPRWFLARTLVYFAVFIGLGSALRAWSRANDDAPRLERVRRMRTWSAGGLPVVALALTWASFDWTMSLTPAWTSTIYGLYWFAGAFVGAIALVCVLMHAGRSTPGLDRVTGDHALAIGRLLFAMTCFWAYMAFSQLLIVWIADLPEEVPFYIARTTGSWSVITYGLVFGHFVLPFFALLNRRAKRSTAYLAAVGAWMLLMHFVDVLWLILPARDPYGVRVRWFDVGPVLWVGGVCAAWIAAQYGRAAPLPRHAPELAEGLDYEAMP